VAALAVVPIGTPTIVDGRSVEWCRRMIAATPTVVPAGVLVAAGVAKASVVLEAALKGAPVVEPVAVLMTGAERAGLLKGQGARRRRCPRCAHKRRR
jgi:hypothetical protein